MIHTARKLKKGAYEMNIYIDDNEDCCKHERSVVFLTVCVLCAASGYLSDSLMLNKRQFVNNFM